MEIENLIIIGSGAAGWTAAIYAARAGLKPLLITGEQLGGQMTIAGSVENFPGFPEAVDGPSLMESMGQQALAVGTRIENDLIMGVDFTGKPLILRGDLRDYQAKAVIIATGATARWLGVEGEETYRGRGVSACATCDGYFYRGQSVAVVGGGNTAVEEALYLSSICKEVHFIHRRDSLKAERILQERLKGRRNIIYHWNSVVKEVAGGAGVMDPITHIVIDKVDGGARRNLKVDGMFVAIGHDPMTAPFHGHVDLDDYGYIAVSPGSTRTAIPGVYAAGDVADRHYRQAVTAAAMGCMAALDVEKWLTTSD
ncbi:thioredoxin-disulfide reductase [Mesorhizobium sp. SP-1A]|uniref:thioredoxin-disulfide reductase n=1 Tax=Mesorhizobium sp. SP-1A TaxID=3077840 RepID=UPI0028F6E9D8|nr:thioredoxin-disulfide reductase [Mesorhizobium sp. SP-1A]